MFKSQTQNQLCGFLLLVSNDVKSTAKKPAIVLPRAAVTIKISNILNMGFADNDAGALCNFSPLLSSENARYNKTDKITDMAAPVSERI